MRSWRGLIWCDGIFWGLGLHPQDTDTGKPTKADRARANRTAEPKQRTPTTTTAPLNERDDDRIRQRTPPAIRPAPATTRHHGAKSTAPPRNPARQRTREAAAPKTPPTQHQKPRGPPAAGRQAPRAGQDARRDGRQDAGPGTAGIPGSEAVHAGTEPVRGSVAERSDQRRGAKRKPIRAPWRLDRRARDGCWGLGKRGRARGRGRRRVRPTNSARQEARLDPSQGWRPGTAG